MGSLVAAMLAAFPVVSIGGGNAMTLPAQRHMVRMDEPGGPIWLIAVQRDFADGHGLVLLRSDGQAIQQYAAIQDDASERDTPDLLPAGPDLALVYSYEGPEFTGSTRHDVYFQWWRFQPATRDFVPSPAVRVFDSTSSSTAYGRAELAIDSLGRIWVQAFRLEADGTNTLVMAVSTNGGASFAIQPPLASLPSRGGGRLLSLGGRLMMLYAMHQNPTPTHFRIRNDGDPLGSWGPEQQAFAEPIYHGAALSAVATPSGGVHLVYKSDFDEQLYYRYFDGASFGPRTLIDTSSDWALQPALTAVGDDLVLCYNHVYSVGFSYDFRVRFWHAGSFGAPQILDGSGDFKGYPASPERLPAGSPIIPCAFGETPDASTGGVLSMDVLSNPFPAPPPDAGPPDAGPPDAGPPDAGPPDAGPPDAGPPDAGGTEQLLFSDDFSTPHPPDTGLGTNWNVVSGLWYSSQYAISDLDGDNQVTEKPATCVNCRVEARMIGFGVPATGLFARAPSTSSTDRYELILTSSNTVRVQRRRSGVVTVLGEASSGLSTLNDWASFALSVSGTGPVQLQVKVNGVPRLSVSDSSSQALTGAGYAGLYTNRAGVAFDDFRLFRTP